MIEYSVRPVTRYFVTRYHTTDNVGSVDTKGEYESPTVAHEVAYALCKAEHDAAGTLHGDPNFVYPKNDYCLGSRGASVVGGGMGEIRGSRDKA